MLPLFEFIATLSATLFAGAAIYVNLVEHPARMSCSTELAATVFAPSYKRGTVMQASLAVIGSLAGFAAWLLGAGPMWLVAAILILAVVPVTLLIIFPVNGQLLARGRNLGSPETRELLLKWGRLHAIRSLLSLIASVIFVWQLVMA